MQWRAISIHHRSEGHSETKTLAWGIFLTLPCNDLSSAKGHCGPGIHGNYAIDLQEPLDLRECLQNIA